MTVKWKVERIGSDTSPVETFCISKLGWIDGYVPRRWGWVACYQCFTMEQAARWIDQHVMEPTLVEWLT